MSVLSAPGLAAPGLADFTRGDARAGAGVWAAIRRQRRLMLAFALVFPVVFYGLLLALLIARFGHVPNYVTPYDWFGNVARIVASTGAVTDILSIVQNEWVLEVGYLNYAYFNGVAEWSLAIIPHKVATVAAVGALIGLNLGLISECPAGSLGRDAGWSVLWGLVTGIAALAATLTCITLYWVVCHSGPSWVVSLAILGVEVSRSLALEPLGPAVSLAGFALLIGSAFLIGRRAGMPGRKEASC